MSYTTNIQELINNVKTYLDIIYILHMKICVVTYPYKEETNPVLMIVILQKNYYNDISYPKI